MLDDQGLKLDRSHGTLPRLTKYSEICIDYEGAEKILPVLPGEII